MLVTDLLARIPFPPRRQAPSAEAPAEDRAWTETAWSGYTAPAAFSGPPAPPETAPLPAYVVLALTAAALSTLGLVAILLASAAPVPTLAEPPPVAPAVAESITRPAPVAAETTFGADPTPVTADVLTRLEQSGNEPLHGELTTLLDAIQHGFGGTSTELDPALRSYTVRMADRISWDPDTFRVAVSAPSADLADARARLLRRLFPDAVASKRLQIRTATGPDALTLVSR